MAKRKGLLFPIALCAASLCLGVGTLKNAKAETVNGWDNYQNGNCTLTDNAGDTVIATAGNTSFGSALVLNETLADNLYGEYDLTFTLTANLSKGEEVWVSIVGIYDTEVNENGDTVFASVSRTGLHFMGNDWMNVALYGNLGETDKGFAQVVNKDENFPALTSSVDVKLSYYYSETGHTMQTLFMNGNEIMTSDLTALYGYYYVHTEAIGFDVFNNSEDVTISNVKAQSQDGVNFRKTNINDFIYYGAEGEFTAKRLTTTIDTADEVFAFTESEQMNAGMFSNGKSHNYEAYAQISGVDIKSGAYEYGYYAWYKNIDNHVLLKTDGAKFYMTVTLNGQVVAEESAACAATEGDEFAFIKRSTSDGKTALTATLKDVTLELTNIEGIFDNYYIGLYGKNVKVSYKGVKTVSFYVAYDFMEQGEWITSGANQDAWNVDGEWPVVTLTDAFAGNTIQNVSIAVTEKVINDPTAAYEMKFNVQSEGNTAYGVVPYYNSDADYVLTGIENIDGTNYLFVRSSHGDNFTQAITATEGNSIQVLREGEMFAVSFEGGDEILVATINGATEISQYYGFFAAGKGTATVLEQQYDGFISFAKYEENGWIKTSVEKDDIKFLENGVITIDGNYKEAGLTNFADQQLAKVIRAEDYTNDYVIEVDLTKIAEPDGQCQRIGVVAWYLDDNNYIVIFVDQWTVWEAYQLNCCGVYNGERMTDSTFNEYDWFLGFLDSPGYIDQTFNLKVIKNGQTLQGFINGKMIFNRTFESKYDLTVYENDTLYLGMFSAGLEAKFENYAVREMASDEGTKTPSAGNRPVENPDDSSSATDTPDSSVPEDTPDSSVPGDTTDSSSSDAPVDDNSSSNVGSGSADKQEEKKGCGSVVGFDVAGLLCLLGVCTLVFKKKE